MSPAPDLGPGPIQHLLNGSTCIEFTTPKTEDVSPQTTAAAHAIFMCVLLNRKQGLVLEAPHKLAECLLESGLTDNDAVIHDMLVIIPDEVCQPKGAENLTDVKAIVRASDRLSQQLRICVKSWITDDNVTYSICLVDNKTKEDFIEESQALHYFEQHCQNLPKEGKREVAVLYAYENCVPSENINQHLETIFGFKLTESQQKVWEYALYGIIGMLYVFQLVILVVP